MPETARRIAPLPLSAIAWAPFGWVPVADTDPADGTHRLSFGWADPHVNLIAHRSSEVEAVDGGLRCDVMFRHRTHTQVLMALDHRCVLAVAPPGQSFDTAAAIDSIAAFALEPLQAIVLERGTWHWGPFPVDAEGVTLFNVQGIRYAEDNDSVDLLGLGLAVEVLTAR